MKHGAFTQPIDHCWAPGPVQKAENRISCQYKHFYELNLQKYESQWASWKKLPYHLVTQFDHNNFRSRKILRIKWPCLGNWGELRSPSSLSRAKRPWEPRNAQINIHFDEPRSLRNKISKWTKTYDFISSGGTGRQENTGWLRVGPDEAHDPKYLLPQSCLYFSFDHDCYLFSVFFIVTVGFFLVGKNFPYEKALHHSDLHFSSCIIFSCSV